MKDQDQASDNDTRYNTGSNSNPPRANTSDNNSRPLVVGSSNGSVDRSREGRLKSSPLVADLLVVFTDLTKGSLGDSRNTNQSLTKADEILTQTLNLPGNRLDTSLGCWMPIGY